MKIKEPIALKSLTDEELLAYLDTKHHDKVLSLIYDRYNKKVYFKAISLVRNEADAKDLAHDIFVKIFIKIKQFKGNSRLSLWIHSISVNTCINYLTKKNKTIFDAIDETSEIRLTDDIYDKETQLLTEIKVEQLQELMYKLKEEDRLLLIMKYLDGMSIKQMVKILQMKPSAIKMRLLRTREKLCKLYEQFYGAYNGYEI